VVPSLVWAAVIVTIVNKRTIHPKLNMDQR